MTETNIFIDPLLTASQMGFSELSFPEMVAKSLARLDPEFLTVLDRIYGISNGNPMTIEETAEDLGTTAEAIDNLHKGALRALFQS